MDILIITNFTSTFSETDNDRFLYLAKLLSPDNEVEILTSDFCHEKKTHRKTPEKDWPFTITFLEEPGYSKNVCLKRFYSHFVWGRKVKKYLKNRKKPDVIYSAVPSLSGPLQAAKYCRKNKIKYVIDVQDLWPEAFQLVFNVPVVSKLIFAPFMHMADKIYQSADAIVAVSKTYLERALSSNKKNVIGNPVFLGTELDTFDNFAKNVKTSNPSENEIRVGYCGTLGSSYDLTSVIKAIAPINKIKVHLIVMGDGPLLSKFQELAESENVKATFTGRLPYDEMVCKLCTCNIVVNPIAHGAAQSIINKHADYVASGLPIVSTQENREFVDLIESYHMGINCQNSNVQEITDAIIRLAEDVDLRVEMGANARRCAEELFDRKTTYKRIVEIITK